MGEKTNDQKEALLLEFFQLELIHLAKSGDQNPKITEHFMKRIKEFLGLPEDMALPTIALGNPESIRHLAQMMYDIKIDIRYIEERINHLKKNPGVSDALKSTKSLNLGDKPETQATQDAEKKPGNEPSF